MKNKFLTIVWFAMVVLLSGGSQAFAAEQQPPSGAGPHTGTTAAVDKGPEIDLRFPLASSRFADVPLALVNDEAVTVRDLTSALEAADEGKKADAIRKASPAVFPEILKRLITVRLMVQEAREMGMDELSEVKEAVKDNSITTVKALLIEDLTKDVKPDEAQVENLRREIVREWKIKSVFFRKEEDAKKMEEEIKAGKGFDELAAKAMSDKTAEGQGEGGYVKPKDLLPEIASVVSKMEVGSVSPVIKVGSGENAGFTLMKLEEIRYPDNAEALEQARGVVLEAASIEEVKNFKRDAYRKTIKVNNKFLDSLDFEAKKPGFQKMLKDKRVIATVKGAKPVTIKDLSEAMTAKFFHGMDRAIESRQVNSKKYEILDGLLEKRLFESEASRRGIEKSERFRAKMKKYEDSLLFGLFVKKVIVPDVKWGEEELKTYYNEHAGDYTTPEMMKVNGLAFKTREQAESVLQRLKEGADFNWMKSNAEGQLDKDTAVLSFVGTTVISRNLPVEVQNALRGARAEEYRLYESPEGHFYVLYVLSAIPSVQQPYEEVRGTLAKEIYNVKLNGLMEEWAGKLREPADVKVFLSSTAAAGETAGKH